ncbi:MAG: CusA/CzcA family heavy metal efflux RND transporter [Negativicutes bacterium]|jgi:Cu(I)/Ag(I) efflux system membrane protein CusA/SilA
MIAAVIAWSVRNKLLVLLFALALVFFGYYSLKNTPLDALPDLSDTQVIIYSEWPGKSPDIIEDQVTYPIVSTLLAAPNVQAVRGFSYLGSSFIYVIFKEGTDQYWARSRVSEYLQSVKAKLPVDVTPQLGPDATSLGWGFSYALVDRTGKYDLAQLRSMQDYNLKLAIESVPGVSQVASIGGFVKQYQITLDPVKLQAYNIPLGKILQTVRAGNQDVEGRVLDFNGLEYMIRGRGYIKSIKDIENIVVAADNSGTPVLIKNIAQVQLGPEQRRGIADLNGEGEVAGGIVVVRFGQNVLSVIDRVKEKIANDIAPSLPKGVEVVTTYDRSDLIYRAIDTLNSEIIKLCIAVAVVCLVFLWHFPSAFVVILTLPVAIIASFIMMLGLGVTANIMSLSGIAIAIGAMVDASIIMVENAHKRLHQWDEARAFVKQPQNETAPEYAEQSAFAALNRTQVIVQAAQEVGPSLFFALLVITVGFLPVFTLEAQAGRLFKPLAYTKTFAMMFAAFLAVTLTPVMMSIFIRGKVTPEERNPVTRLLQKIYHPVVVFVLRWPKSVLAAAIVVLLITLFPFLKIGSEFMPPLYEGSLLYMPTTMPGASINEAAKLLQTQDKALKSVPEVAQVYGKAGRAETATDPAPLEMFETVITLKPESEWRSGMTIERLTQQLNEAVSLPGVSNSFTMPIKARIDMLATGIRTPVGIKIFGANLNEIEKIGVQLEQRLRDLPGTRNVYAERVNVGYYLDVTVNRDQAARYGLTVQDVEEAVQTAVGGMNVATTIEGRERYPVNIRYQRDWRSDVEQLKRILVPVMMAQTMQNAGLPSVPQSSLAQDNLLLQVMPQIGATAATGGLTQVPLGQLAEIKIRPGPTGIKSEQGLLSAYVYIDVSDKDIGGYVKRAKAQIANVAIPAGYRLEWSGEYEFMQKTASMLWIVIPLTLLLIFLLLYLNTRSFAKTAIVLLAVPFSLVGSFWLLYLLNYNMSTAVWVGLIALAGLDAETGVVMLLYLDLAYNEARARGELDHRQLDEAIMHGAVKRIRPKMMTVCVIIAGLLPIMFSSGAGSDVMKRIAAPMLGGVATSTILELVVYPVIYRLWRGRGLKP